MSVPSRLVISAIAIVTVLIRPERFSGILLFICVADGMGALAMGCIVGFTGKVPDGEKQRSE